MESSAVSNPAQPNVSVADADAPRTRSTLLRRGLLLAAAIVLAWGAYELVDRSRGLSKAVELARFELWEQARGELSRYLLLYPRDAKARFLMAELWANDDDLLASESVPQAIFHLRSIPDDAPLAATARTHEAKLTLLVLHQPVAAEKLLHQAIRLDENHRDAYQLLCTLMEMTGRYHDTEGYFWRLYELTPPEERALRLRDWYMGQFFPLTANEPLDQQMGFHEAATSTVPVEAVRYLRFREAEPDEPLGRALLARWTRRVGRPADALSILTLGDDDLENEFQDPFFVTTLLDLLIDLGEYQQADERFQKWPGPHEGFHYWRLKAILLEEAHGDFEAALEAYDKALGIWPGPSDWRLLHRKAGCLSRAGRREEAVEARTRAKVIEDLMQDEVHRRLRYILGFLDKPDHLREVAEYYRKLGRSREASAWSAEAARRIADALE